MIALPKVRRIYALPALWVNDVHSGLNRTRVSSVIKPSSEDDLISQVGTLLRNGQALSVSGGRHAMGGQQFLKDGVCLDLRGCNRILRLDRERGLLEVEAGIQWPALIADYLSLQKNESVQWGINQKQTGADSFTIGGSLGANIHGRGLKSKPMVEDIEAFRIIRPDGFVLDCSRNENVDLFKLAIGGYGLFGVVSRVTLRLKRRVIMERHVEMLHVQDLISQFGERMRLGDQYGDFQFSIDEKSSDFLQWGVLASYRASMDQAEMPCISQALSSEQWIELLRLAYTNRSEGFRRYVDHYLFTNGQRYWSDLHQLSPYLPDYRKQLARLTNKSQPTSLMISELYVPRPFLAEFLKQAAVYLRKFGPPVIYGTVRLIEKEDETFLAWAKQPWACVIFNLLIEQNGEGISRAQKAFRYLIDLAISVGGSYYLTYHRWARKDQVETCHPHLRPFLEVKGQHDPEERFQSDWYRYYRDLLVSDT